jgi:hypothetical protein
MWNNCRSTLLAVTSFAVTFVCAIYAMSSAQSLIDFQMQGGAHNLAVAVQDVDMGPVNLALSSPAAATTQAKPMMIASDTRYYLVPLGDVATSGYRALAPSGVLSPPQPRATLVSDSAN